ncbi:Hypothetical protein CM240_1097 [Clostridium bornimense]|uniref:Glycosyltransferase 2-like domain-containing protein n=1 Tax=Clostridium bornimense TaxID=1216932 RepID=W6RUE1_9CLOT|nr:glycosyltransferase family 2 protein [Clostridium bornimense]CDM68261.1 Hypothetical protein CM240_1097 [Clostridium bornimense]
MIPTEKIDEFNNLLNNYITDMPILYRTVDFFQKSLEGNLSLDGIEFYLKNYTGLSENQYNTLLDYFKEILCFIPKDNTIIDENKLISVVIPTYNQKGFLQEAINSVLSQSYKNIELIIIDDASNDGTEEIVTSKYGDNDKVSYYKNSSNLGTGKTIVKGYNLIKGDYFVVMGHDDFYIDMDFFKNAIKLYNDHENISFICGGVLISNTKYHSIEKAKVNLPFITNGKEYFENLLLNQYQLPNCSIPTIFNKKLLDKTNPGNSISLDDVELYMKALLTGDAIMLSNFVSVYRVHGNNSSFNYPISALLNSFDSRLEILHSAINDYNIDENVVKNLHFRLLNTSIPWYFASSKVSKEDYTLLIDWLNSNALDYLNNNLNYLNHVCINNNS